MNSLQIMPIINKLSGSMYPDSEKWNLLLMHKKKIERQNEIRIELKKKTNKHLRKLGVRVQDIRTNPSINPFPVGRCNIEKIVGGREVSEKIKEKMNDFFNELK